VSIAIVGAGPNLGRAIAQRFGRERLPVGFIARSTDKLRGLTDEVRAEGLTASYAVADIRDAAALQSAIRELAGALGPVEVLEYSPLPARD
jgi:NADP-dependent 3-hydroxy acid dehydrogenase YdfG